MKLHQDKNAFSVLLDTLHRRTGYRTDVLEKDYYVVLILRELSQKQQNGRGVSAITDVYGRDAFRFTENSIRVTIPFLETA